ncbi:hypothetical protein ACVDG5_015675 [Mesorhizobium sp. ORM6]
MDRFEILNEPTGTYSIFDRSTELPVTEEGRIFIGLNRHEVPLALLAAIETVRSGDEPVLPSLSVLGGCRTDQDENRQDDLQA